MNKRYDIIIIGSGAGGGTAAYALADTAARILILERGDFIPQEEENWSPEAVWKQLRYRTRERWLDEHGTEFLPYTHYNVGGNTKFWGSVLYRMRREDFHEMRHADRVSPAWPIDYDTLAPYYEQAERLYQVHGQQGADPGDKRQAVRCPIDPDERVHLQGQGDQQGREEQQAGAHVRQCVQRDETPSDPVRRGRLRLQRSLGYRSVLQSVRPGRGRQK